MSDKGEKTCPLCAEEMDLTDQQLKPCKCGYEICIWCWHHIMEMAEKDETQGRCPACRTPYNKEKVVGMASKCERLVTEMNVEKKLKSQKGKSKTFDGRKQLDSVRVIQRNLVYVVGLPFHLADEDILQRREYFAQYGKVLKVSISRTTTGAIQHSPNNTCSVYITYSKVEEALRCIHMVHGFVLDGHRLRACFGTTKYCHAWLKNLPCSNPDCLYLHETGSQEDSFSKDEIITAYTRNGVQHFTDATCSTQRRSGSVLPSPTEDHSDNGATFLVKPTAKAPESDHNLNGAKASPPDTNPNSAPVPTASSWVTRSPSCQTSETATRVNGTLAHEPYVHDGLRSFSKASISVNTSSFMGDEMVHNGNQSISQDPNPMESSEPTKVGSKKDGRASFAGTSVSSLPISQFTSSVRLTNLPTTVPSSKTYDLSEPGNDFVGGDGNIEYNCSAILSNIHADQKPQNGYIEHIGNSVIGQKSDGVVNAIEVHSTNLLPSFHSGLQTQQSHGILQQKESDTDTFSLRNERVDGPEINVSRVPDISQASIFAKHSSIPLQKNNVERSILDNLDRQIVDRSNMMPYRHPENILNSQECGDAVYSELSLGKDTRSLLSRYKGEAGRFASDLGESSIISNMLTSDFDPWNESCVSSLDLAKMFIDEKKQAYTGVIGSRKLHNSSQSRFAFARDEDLSSQLPDFGQSSEDAFKQHLFVDSLLNNNSLQADKSVNQNHLPVISSMEPDIFTNVHPQITSSKLPVSRSQISAPPGFSVPSRLPPPGFSSIGTEHNILGSFTGSHSPDASFSMRNQCQFPLSSNNAYVNGDVEFIDPAILTVGKGTLATNNNSIGIDTRSSFPPQFGYSDPRVQRSPYDNHRYTDIRDTNISSLGGNAYGIPSRMLDQKLYSNNVSSHFSTPQSINGLHWDNWNGRNNLDMPELIRTDRFGFNGLYPGHDDSKMRIPSPSSDTIYNGIYRF